jgi:hypothetical protein
MKNLEKLAPALLMSVVLGLAFSATVSAADKATPPEPRYDKATVVHFSATVTAVREVPKGLALDGLHLTVQSGLETLDVYVGPTEFVKVFDVTFKKGDSIDVKGSKVKFEGATLVLASEVSMGNVTLLLRDKEGAPLWKYFIKPPVG